jgi:hypothetical protein
VLGHLPEELRYDFVGGPNVRLLAFLAIVVFGEIAVSIIAVN